ncbi:hypothetical protein OMP38_06010 [Cohnella ginsengisoli]|uniref:Uncharacterized protein n=1 Tax=Cohnella ginsengisoli TaxID=425004 RepID=A0A9X4KF49_9BACL|nr:hypothetical protein [Cohnella ginsengisoli]MDG0790449.1 hypothetical protein [Cohnella ginsengisoli]
MGKSKYYVSVQARTINTQRGDAAYEFEIEAGEEELVQLQELFDSMDEFDQAGFWRSHQPFFGVQPRSGKRRLRLLPQRNLSPS